MRRFERCRLGEGGNHGGEPVYFSLPPPHHQLGANPTGLYATSAFGAAVAVVVRCARRTGKRRYPSEKRRATRSSSARPSPRRAAWPGRVASGGCPSSPSPPATTPARTSSPVLVLMLGLLLPQEASGRPPLVGGEGGSGKPSLLSPTKSVVFKSTHRLPQNAEEGNRPAEVSENVDVKILYQGLITRLQQKIGNFIDEDESGFMSGRNIVENSIYAAELVQCCHKRAPTLVFKLDFTKAFDSIA
ncbi:hypothetical protein D1007_17175 [Hordeum vulgare]|nr:hypothetical protein D1007_17175 [Hordeum vulgare]